jgi:hypothetical protein
LDKDFDDGNRLTLIGEYAIESVFEKGLVKGACITDLKLILVKNPSAFQFFDLENEGEIKSHKEAVTLFKTHLLNAKFNRNLELKIAQDPVNNSV